MVDIINILFYFACLGVGFVLGVTLVTKRYQNKVMEVLEYLYFSKKIDKEEYEHFKEKHVVKQDTLKNINETIKKFRKKKVSENE